MIEETCSGVQTLIFGALPIVGMFCWKWSAIEMFLFLLASLWVGIFCDLTKLMFSFEIGVDIYAVTNRRLLLAVAALLVFRSFYTAWKISQHRQSTSQPNANPAADRPVRAAVGLRGTGLFFLMFLVVFLADKTEDDSDTIWISAMIVANGLVVLCSSASWLAWASSGQSDPQSPRTC